MGPSALQPEAAAASGRVWRGRDEIGDYLCPSLRLAVIPLMGLSSASRNRAQKSVAPPPLITAARTMFGPFLIVMRLETPSSMTVWRSPKMPMISWPLTHHIEAALEAIARRTLGISRGQLTMVTAQNSTLEVGL